MDRLSESLVAADDAAGEVLTALEHLRAALQASYDAAGARWLPLAHDLGPLVARAERMAADVGRARKVVAPHAARARAEAGCVV